MPVLATALVIAFAVKVAWVAINFWNAAIGFVIRRSDLFVGISLKPAAIETRVAVAMTICNEDVLHCIARLRSMKISLDASGCGADFDYFLLSDSSDPEIVASETSAIEMWRKEFGDKNRLTYRRRAQNTGAQHGNLYEFCRQFGAAYEIMIVVDADSLMTAAAILELVNTMHSNPRIGMLQSVNCGILMPSVFARILEFGHRHGMRCWVAGTTWWQGDRCQYRGHNAAIRVAAYVKHCSLADLPGKTPFGGVMFCHDQIESLLMHRAGYEIRELPYEHGSYEGLPPTLVDFVVRYCRWFQGNLINLRLLRLSGLTAMDRYHLIGVAHRFLSWPAMILFVLLAAWLAGHWPSDAVFPAGPALGLYAAYLVIYFMPKILGLLDSALTAPRDYGGVGRLVLGGGLDIVLTLLFVPIAMLTATGFFAALAFGRTLSWETQKRRAYRPSWGDAARQLWGATVVGIALTAALASAAPAALPWFLPFLAGLLLAIPLTVVTTSDDLFRLFAQWRLCALPEDIKAPSEITAVLDFETKHQRSEPGRDVTF